MNEGVWTFAFVYVHIHMCTYICRVTFTSYLPQTDLEALCKLEVLHPPFLLHMPQHWRSLDPRCYTWVCQCRTETVRAGETAGSRSHHLEWDWSHPGANLLHRQGWHEVSSSPTSSSSARLKDCPQYCLTWWYLGWNHMMESEVHREWKHRLSPKNNQLPQNLSGLSAVEFCVS